MSEMIDDKSDHCISFIVDCLQSIKAEDDQHSPLFLGMNGAQGSGKSTLVIDSFDSNTAYPQNWLDEHVLLVRSKTRTLLLYLRIWR